MRCWIDLLGAEVRHVSRTRGARAGDGGRGRRAPEVRTQAVRVPIGASTPLGAPRSRVAVAELLEQIEPPDVIVHATSSGGTQAGLVAGCAMAGVRTRVIGISADERSDGLAT